MTDEIYYSDKDGNIKTDNPRKPIPDQKRKECIRSLIENNLNSEISKFEWSDDFSGKLTYYDKTITIHFKYKTTEHAGRNRKPNNWRIQASGSDLSELAAFSNKNEPSFIVGIYNIPDHPTLQLWYIDKSSNRQNISKYIDITNISESYKFGISKYKSSGSCSYSIQPKYLFPLIKSYDTISTDNSDFDKIQYNKNRIIFGAPGTGKSYKIKMESKSFKENIERVTFHPNYSYGQFVGTYKPVSIKDQIKYQFVPGPFIRLYVKCLKNPESNYLLIIEEINRANVSAVFGDIFQLLDRKNGKSEYPISSSEDVKNYLIETLYPDFESYSLERKNEVLDVCSKIIIPSNMYIWATMNSSDQGVFPMDTAFKRRWNFEYVGIDEGEEFTSPELFNLPDGSMKTWNDVRKYINQKLLNLGNINEDKLIGPFFISDVDSMNDFDFNNIIKTKVIMYIFEDVSKFRRSEIFSGCSKLTYSSICEEYDKIGLKIFGTDQ